MAVNTQQDSILRDKLYFPYNRILSPHDDTPRIIDGLNTYVTTGGKLSRRPATVAVPFASELGRVDRIYLYETLNGKIYLLASLYDVSGNKWTMFYNRLSAGTGWTQIGTLRSCDDSAAPQEVSIARGLAYIRNVPNNPGTDPYGTAVFDGTITPTLRPWGVPPPSTPAAIIGAVAKLSSNITAEQTTFSLDSNFSPAPTPNFVIIIDYEEMLVTANSSGNLTVTRGYNGTTATSHRDNSIVTYRNFGASSHRVDVSRGWEYAYAYVSTTGQISNISPPQTNPDLLPSNTGPFIDLVPAITITGLADTTNFPSINIYRTTDGFGQYYFLEQIPNPGNTTVVYYDNSLASDPTSTTFNDPVPDSELTTRSLGPTLNSNSPPPTVLSPGIVGISAPVRGTPIAYYAGRHWYAIDNYVFFSGNEEVTEGVPEECFPTGLLKNEYKFQHAVVNLRASSSALYISTIHDTYVVTGTTRDQFAVRPLYPNVGSPADQPLSMITFKDKVAVLTSEYRIAILENNREPRIISDPLYTDIKDAIIAGGECELSYFADLDKDWLVISIHNPGNTALSKQFVYDFKLSQKTEQDFWFTPWSIPSVSVFSGRIYEEYSTRYLCFFVYEPLDNWGVLVNIDPTATTNTDIISSNFTATPQGIDFYADFHQHTLPPGNHANLLRIPNLTPVVNQLTLERILYPGDSDPNVYYYCDDIWTDPIPVDLLQDPQRRNLSLGYKTHIATLNEACFRFSFRIQLNKSVRPFDLLGYAITWNPDAGA